MDNSEGEGYEVGFLSMVELLWGKGFIAPGGEGNVDRIVEGIDLTGKDVLEIGSGLGGGTMVLAGKYGARVLGLEIEAPLVERATQYAREAGPIESSFGMYNPVHFQLPMAAWTFSTTAVF